MPEDADKIDDLERLARERDLYLRLLELGMHDEIEPFLSEALALVVEVIGARLGYLELRDESDGREAPCWSMAHGLSGEDLDRVRSAISSGIIAEALATGETIATPSALNDPRFEGRSSVVTRRIEAVLCTPIGTAWRRGVLYLQGRIGAGPFSEEDQQTAQTFARHLAPFADRLLAWQQRRPDPTSRARAKLRLDGVIGRSPALATLLEQVALIAGLDVSVLLTGESGTGKSQIARVIHENSPRARYPFVQLNCAALPEGLVESELFGSMPGAHSTATRRIEGKVAAAEHGTLLLDEVGDLALPAQVKLLQLLQSKQYYPLGSPRPLVADVRVIAATNVDLTAAVAERRFREDLFYRLEVVPLRAPRLAERREDVAELARCFCEDACQRHGLPRVELSPRALHALESAEWPGNVRQLAHTVEAATIRAAGERATAVERNHLFPESLERPSADDGGLTFQEQTRRFQARMLREALDEADWNVVKVADRLDLARSHVYALIRAFGLKRNAP